MAVEEITVQFADESQLRFLHDDQRAIDLLKPGEKDALASYIEARHWEADPNDQSA